MVVLHVINGAWAVSKIHFQASWSDSDHILPVVHVNLVKLITTYPSDSDAQSVSLHHTLY